MSCQNLFHTSVEHVEYFSNTQNVWDLTLGRILLERLIGFPSPAVSPYQSCCCRMDVKFWSLFLNLSQWRKIQFISLWKDIPPWGKKNLRTQKENFLSITGNKLYYVHQKLRVGPYMLRFEELPSVKSCFSFFFFV